jgi:Fur family transcriptional regulator, ferric uptake regulator
MVRATKQRKTIHNVLVKYRRPLSVSEILKLAQNEVAGLGIATVYRNLKALQEEGQVIQVDLPGQSPRWEVTPGGHHHHFLCRKCDKLFEIHDCPRDIQRILPKGYILEEHDVLLRGQCDACSRTANTRQPKATAE